MAYEEFKIDSMPERLFRVAKISPVDLMAITQVVDFEKFESSRQLISFCLESAETLIGEKWLPVKMKGRDVYQPMGIESDLPAMTDIYLWMMENVIAKSFTRSSASHSRTE